MFIWFGHYIGSRTGNAPSSISIGRCRSGGRHRCRCDFSFVGDTRYSLILKAYSPAADPADNPAFRMKEQLSGRPQQLAQWAIGCRSDCLKVSWRTARFDRKSSSTEKS